METKQQTESKAAQGEITLFAKTNFRNKEVPFGIKTDDRRRHMYVIGKTGMGKTTMMENMVIQDILNDKGVAFVDPHGDSVEKILNYIPSKRVNDVIYFNPADLEYPIAFNILEAVDQKYKHLVASGLMGVFTKIWANLWSARMEYILNNAIFALLDSPGNTLLGISRLLVDKKYRKRIVDNIKDPMIRSFWTDEFSNWPEKYRQEAVAPIQNKVGQFLSSGIIRNIVGQPKSTIDLRSIMDEKKILLLNLSKGKVGEDNSDLLGAMIITKLQLAALSRVDIPEEQRPDFYLYVDEFQNFATDSFATILSEARKYRLNLTVGHQYIGQLVTDKNTKVRDAVFGNVGTIVSFRVGAADAEFLEKEFEPTFSQTDLVNLPKYLIILRLMINGVASEPFSATTLAPSTYQTTDNAAKVVRVSRERYSNPIADVEEKITRWMGQDYHEQVAVIAAGAKFEHARDEEEAEEQQQPAPAQTAAPQVSAQSVAHKQEFLDARTPAAAEAPIASGGGGAGRENGATSHAAHHNYAPRAHNSGAAAAVVAQSTGAAASVGAASARHENFADRRKHSSNMPRFPERRGNPDRREKNVRRKESPIWNEVLKHEHKKDSAQELISSLEKSFVQGQNSAKMANIGNQNSNNDQSVSQREDLSHLNMNIEKGEGNGPTRKKTEKPGNFEALDDPEPLNSLEAPTQNEVPAKNISRTVLKPGQSKKLDRDG